MRIKISFFIILSSLLINCSEKTNNPQSSEPPPQYIILNANYVENSFGDTEDDILSSGTILTGEIAAVQIPSIEYIKINDSIYTVNPSIGFGNITFSLQIDNNQVPPEQLDVEIKTSVGIMYGSVTLPDTVTNLQLNPATPSKSQPLTISWKSSADFFKYSQSGRFGTSNGLTTSNEIRYDTDDLRWMNGEYYFDVFPVNGPLPGESNMTGDGVGFLTYKNKSNRISFVFESAF